MFFAGLMHQIKRKKTPAKHNSLDIAHFIHANRSRSLAIAGRGPPPSDQNAGKSRQ